VPSASHSDPVPDWLLVEIASAGRENLDPEHVARYDDKEDAKAEEEVAVCQSIGLGPSSTVVEFGSGTGQFTTAVASKCARVVAVDVSAVMQDRLHAKLKDAGIGNVEQVQAGFLTYRHTGEPADLVYSRFALHHLPDFWKAVALDRIHGILRPGGILRLWDVVFSFEPGDSAERIESWCSTGGPNVEDDWSRAELEEHIRDEHSTFSWILEPMAVRCGLAVESADYSEDEIVAKYVFRRS
jgi:ubiquinone/menaquinone biosynthesis C-methylase UbiE